MKNRISLYFFLFIMSFPAVLFSQEDGKAIFRRTCAACHTVNRGKLIGPDLANIHKRRENKWIFDFVKSSQTLINSGDADAVAIYEEFNKTLMPDQILTDPQIQLILDYIIENSQEEVADGTQETPDKKVEEVEPEREITADDIETGRNLFSGHIRLTNGGPTCNSCHHIMNDNVVAGGAFAKELTEAYSRLSLAGISAILNFPPFPAMQLAYGDHPITEEEAFQLAAFLKHADEQKIYQHPRDYGKRMLYSGLIGAFFLMGVIPLLWLRRKNKSVNHKIYNRQIKSAN